MADKMSLTSAKILLSDIGMTINKTSAGDYRVSFLDGPESSACYEDSVRDAYGTALAMYAHYWKRQCTKCGHRLTDAASDTHHANWHKECE